MNFVIRFGKITRSAAATIFVTAVFVVLVTTLPCIARTRTFDVLHYEIHTSFDRKKKTVFGDTTIRLKPLSNNFRILELDATGMKFDFVRLAPEGAVLDYKQSDQKLLITLDKNYSAEGEIAVRLRYSAKPTKGVYFLNDEAEVNGFRRPAQIWTQGEPEDNRHWFPSYDFPDDKSTTEQFITVAENETAIANGELIETRTNPDQTKTFHYRTSFVHSSYLTSFVVGRYSYFADQVENVKLGYFVYPGSESLVPKAFGRTRDIIRIFEEITKTKFPFGKYDQILIGNAKFGGMENVTATTFSDVELLNIDNRAMQTEDLVVHELAHSWFGNFVTCKDWGDLWLNEGFASFMEAAYREHVYGRADYLRKIREDTQIFLMSSAFKDNLTPLSNSSATASDSLFNTVNYEKGGVVLHMLREFIGDKAFWDGITLYLRRHQFANADTLDLKRAFEETSSTKLDQFFQQWVFGSSRPRFKVSQRFKSNSQEFTLIISQVKDEDWRNQSPFVFDLEVELNTASGNEAITIPVRHSLHERRIRLKNAPTSIEIDPNFRFPLIEFEVSQLKTSRK